MKINTITSFTASYEKVCDVTNSIIQAVPEAKMDWTYASGKFTIGDLIRPIAAIESNLFAELILGNQENYTGYGKKLAENYADIIYYFNKMHSDSMEVFTALHDHDLCRNLKTVNGSTTTIGNFLRALVAHEIHHRSVLCIYLNLIGIRTPPELGTNSRTNNSNIKYLLTSN